MRVLSYLGFSVTLLCSVVFADHQEEGKKHDHTNDPMITQLKKDVPQHPIHHQDPHPHQGDQILSQKFTLSNANFAFNLFAKLADDRPEENIVFSPVSISTALTLLSLGAMAETRDQIIEGLGFNTTEIPEKEIHRGFQSVMEILNDDNRELHLDSGNGLFISELWKILDEFLGKAKSFHSEAFTVNFQKNEEAKKQINSYVEKKTNGKIVDLLSSVDKDAALIFVNFIYFRGKWEKPFDAQFTKEDDFHVNPNHTVKVPFMSRTGLYKTGFLDEATVVSVPYKGNASALFILPNEGKAKEVRSNLYDIVRKWKLSSHTRVVDLRIPKFTTASSFNLKEVLPKFGIVNVFSNSADLSGITGAPNLKVSKVIHKAEIAVDEKGTEAAGATVIEAIPMMIPPMVKFDRPFYYCVFDHNARMNLFTGQVVNPKK